MGASLSLTPFSCTHSKRAGNMKVFATLATLLGFTYADPNVQSAFASNGLRSYNNNIMRPSSMMEMSMDRQMDRPMSMDRQMDRPMMMDRRQMSDRRMSPMRTMYRDDAFGPNQYFLRDDYGNYDYGYANQNSERFEEGNGQGSVKGHYVDYSNGMTRRVDYIADDQGFHILGDNKDRFKRSVDPDLFRTRMTSYMDASSLRDDSRDMLNNMDRNMMGRNMDRSMMDRQMSGRNMYRMMSDRGMSSNMRDMSRNNLMSRNMMDNNMMRDSIMSRNMMDNNNMMRDSMMSRNMYGNMMGRDMNNMMGRDRIGQDMTSNMMMNSYRNEDGLLGERNTMSQRMEVERFPELSNRFF